MALDEARERLKEWNFETVKVFNDDTLVAADSPQKSTQRQFTFHFCNDKLAGLAQAISPAAEHLVVIVGNYIEKYGQPMRVEADTNVIASGEKHTLTMFWRDGPDYVVVRMTRLPDLAQLAVERQAPNTCWRTPR